MATMGGAIALGLDSKLGSIAVGKMGKLIFIRSNSAIADPYDLIFTSKKILVAQLGYGAISEDCG